MRSKSIGHIAIKLAWIVVLFFNASVWSQNTLTFERISTDDGLSQSDINCIYQDHQGFMWFGTHDGLNKYDGYDFSVFNPDKNNPGSVSSNLIFKIEGDNNGNLWIGTTGSGLNFFDRSTGKFRVFKHEDERPHSISNDHITALYKDKKDRLWIGTHEGLNMLDLTQNRDSLVFERFNPEEDPFVTGWDGNAIFAIFEDSKNRIWVGGHNGLYRMSRDRKGDLYFQLVNESIGLPNINVRCIAEDKFGRLILGTTAGLYLLGGTPGSNKILTLYEGSFNDLAISADNHIWAASSNGLLYFRNADNLTPPKFVERFTYDPRNSTSLSKDIVKSLYVDRTGIIWAGTNGGGLNKFDPERKQFRHIRKTDRANSLSYDKIRSMYEDSNGTLWIGTEGGGLNMLHASDDRNYTNFRNFQKIPRAFAITEVQLGGKKKLLIGAEDSPGLYEVDISPNTNISEESFKVIPEINRSVFALLEDSNKNIWIGTYAGGVHRWLYNKATGTYQKDVLAYEETNQKGISSNIIRNIKEDEQGNIWFATGDGLCKLSPKEALKSNPNFDIYQNIEGDANSLSHDYILSIYESKLGDLWIGTFGGGLDKFVPGAEGEEDRFINYSEGHGLPNNVIKGILEDEAGSLWISTNKGLSKFDPESEIFKNYDRNDGLQNNEFQELACLKRKDGEMLFGGINGFNAFYPEYITDNTFDAETVITNFSVFNEDVHSGEEVNGRILLKSTLDKTEKLRLKHWENNFSFEFSALHFAAPRKNKYAYILEGFDEDWVFTTADKRFATYTNLEPGDYIFKVKASNNDGIWDSTPSQLAVTVVPPFWKTIWAYLAYGLIALLLLWAFRKYTIIRTTEKHQLELEHIEKENSEELQRLKLEFFTNISHEFRTPLTLIKGPLEYLQKTGLSLNKKEVEEQYEIMHKNTNYLMRLVNQLLDFRKISKGKMKLVLRNSDIVAFIKEIGEPFQFLAHRHRINFKMKTPYKSVNTWFDHDALEKIMNNLLSNAFKFTPENGKVTVSLDLEGDPGKGQVVIKIKDSGPGIPLESVGKIFDRFYVEKDKNKKNLDGAGIGLSFTKKLTELHKGSIDVKSKPNKGTTFIVRLPQSREVYEGVGEISIKEVTDNDYFMRSSEAESLAVSINDELADENLSKSRSKLPVLLVVDDNRDIRTFIKHALKKDYAVVEAENGKEGLRLALKILPNIILTDIIMPVMDGVEFCEKLKTRQETSHIPVIMLTAKASQESEMEGLKNGADDYIKKPFDMEVLQLKLLNTIKHREELRKRFNRDVTLQPKEVTVTSTDELFLKKAIEIVELHMMDTDFNVEMMVKEMGHSRSNLYLKFKELTGLSSSEFIRNIRLKRAMQLLEQSNRSVKEIMYMTGFNTASYFSKCFKKQFGVIPSEYVKHIRNTEKLTKF
ncbi:MAG: two-component regulator propeller domain-containing protein [Flavobacteriaceae bacterium]